MDRDAVERKQLEELRRSLGQQAAEPTESEARLKKLFTEEGARLLKVKPIVRVRWSRKVRNPKTGVRICVCVSRDENMFSLSVPRLSGCNRS